MMTPQIHALDPLELNRLIQEKNCLLIDVREPQEHYYEHIAEAQLFPISTFDPSKLPPTGNKTLVFYCKGGVRSAKAARKYLESGASHAYHLTGGIDFWKEHGLPIVSGLEPGTDSAAGFDQ